MPLPVFDREPDADPAGGRLGVHDRQVLGFLLAGHTDVSVARQLGRSLRWVQRRVRLMMDAAGVRTRLQLGWEARRRGWVDDTGNGAAQPPVVAP